MKVLRVITRLNVGGPARQVLALQKEMRSLGVDETLVTGSVDSGEADLAVMLGESEFIRVDSLLRPVRPVSDVRAYRALNRIINQVRPDVVHTHMSKAGLLGRIAALRRKVPVLVHTFHGHVLESYFSSSVARLVKVAERQLARRTTTLLTVGEGVRQDLQTFGVAPATRVHVMAAGIDLAPFADIGPPGGLLRGELGIPERAPIVGFAGRFVPVKRIDRLAEAVRRIAAGVPDAHFVVCGDGPDRPLLEAVAADPMVGSRLHLVGWLSDLRAFYAAVNVVILTSANEGTPISLIEAGAAGRPVVATGVGGVADVVRDGETGFVVEGAAASVAAATIELLTRPDLASSMGAAGRSRILPRYSAVRLASDLVALYERELSSRVDRMELQ